MVIMQNETGYWTPHVIQRVNPMMTDLIMVLILTRASFLMLRPGTSQASSPQVGKAYSRKSMERNTLQTGLGRVLGVRWYWKGT